MTTTFTIEIDENLGPIAGSRLTDLLEDVVNKNNYTLNDCSYEVERDEDDI